MSEWMTYGDGGQAWPVWAQRTVEHGHDDDVIGCPQCDADYVLHVVREADDDGEDGGWWTSSEGTTVCGLERAWLSWPGMFSRMNAPRCPSCCEAVGIPPGDGHPKNDPVCRAILGYDDPPAGAR